jgi:Methyltransferase domain
MLKKFINVYLYVLGKCLYILSFGMFKKQGRVSLITIATALDYYKKQHDLILPVIKSEILELNANAITVADFGFEDGNTTNYELCIINALIVKYKPVNVFEIGTFDGRTALNMAFNLDGGGKVFTLDLPKASLPGASLAILQDELTYIDKETPGIRIKNSAVSNKIVQLLGDSATFDFSSLPKINFIFIDGSHAYDYVIKDSLNSIAKIEDKGIIVWHDYGSWTEVTLALNFLHQNNPLFKDIRQIENTSIVLLQVNKG